MKHLFLAMILSLFPVMNNQNGFIGFGPDRYTSRMLLDKKKDAEGGGGTGEEEEEEEEDDSESGTPGKDKGKKKSGTSDAEDEDEDDQTGSDFSKLPPETQKMIKKLRNENKTLRANNKSTSERMGKIEQALKLVNGDGEDDEAPEVKLGRVNAQNEELAITNAFKDLALEHSINKEQFKYFSFLMNEAISELGEDEEMDEEQLESIVAEAKAKAPKASSTTSVTGKKGGQGPKKSDTVTAEQFKKLGIIGRSKLYRENPDLYNSLSKETGF